LLKQPATITAPVSAPVLASTGTIQTLLQQPLVQPQQAHAPPHHQRVHSDVTAAQALLMQQQQQQVPPFQQQQQQQQQHHRVHSDMGATNYNNMAAAPTAGPAAAFGGNNNNSDSSGFARENSSTLRSVDMAEVMRDVHPLQHQGNGDTVRSVDFCMNVLVEAASAMETEPEQPAPGGNAQQHTSNNPYNNTDTLRSEDLNRLFQMGEKEWDSVMNQKMNSNSIRSNSGGAGMSFHNNTDSLRSISGGSSSQMLPPMFVGGPVGSSSNEQHARSGSMMQSMDSIRSNSSSTNNELPFRSSNSMMMQSMDSLRSTTSSQQQQSMRSDDLTRLFQMNGGEQPWDGTVMEE